MARTIVLHGPASLETPAVKLCADDDSVTETITLAEATNRKGRYTGALTAAAATYTAVVYSGATAVGVFTGVVVSGDDPETVNVEPTANTTHIEGTDATDAIEAAATAAIAAAEPAIASAARDAILNRVLSGNHDAAGTPGKLLQDAPSVEQIWTGLDANQLAKFATFDTGETAASDGSVARIAQGAVGGNVTVEAFTAEADAELQSAAAAAIEAALEDDPTLNKLDSMISEAS